MDTEKHECTGSEKLKSINVTSSFGGAYVVASFEPLLCPWLSNQLDTRHAQKHCKGVS